MSGKIRSASVPESRPDSDACAQERMAAGFWTPGHRSDEPEEGFDSAYLSWRQINGDAHDSDYRRWRAETGQPFSQAFLQWVRDHAIPAGVKC